jgi:hypothetical protein
MVQVHGVFSAFFSFLFVLHAASYRMRATQTGDELAMSILHVALSLQQHKEALEIRPVVRFFFRRSTFELKNIYADAVTY